MAGRFVVGATLRQVGLRNISAFVIVGIFVSLAMTERLGPLVMGVSEVRGNLQGAALGQIFLRLAEGGIGTVALRCRGQLDGRMSQRDAGLGETNELDGLLRGNSQCEGQGIGQSDILTGKDHQASCDESQFLPSMEHLG